MVMLLKEQTVLLLCPLYGGNSSETRASSVMSHWLELQKKKKNKQKTAPVYLAGFEHCSPYGPEGKPAFPEVQESKKAGQSEGSASKEESGKCLKRRELIAGHATQM